MNIPHKHTWMVVTTIWPYEPGYGSYCNKCKLIGDTGLTIEDARESVRQLKMTHPYGCNFKHFSIKSCKEKKK